MNMQITFHLDGCGVYYDPNEPIHIDSLLAWTLAVIQHGSKHIDRDDTPDDVQLPLLRSRVNGVNVWHASALFPDGGDVETLRFWRKKFRASRVGVTSGSPNLMSGVYREYNVPVPLLLAPRMIGYASGSGKEARRLLKQIKSIGKKRAYGYGKVMDVEVIEINSDYSFVKDGKAMRFLPSQNGTRLIRCAPPYWNNVGRVLCCEVGDDYIV